MTKKSDLTGAEYKALREACGLTLEEAARLHGVKNITTIKRWENGYTRVSELAETRILELWGMINRTVEEYKNIVEINKGIKDIVLIQYSDADYPKYQQAIPKLKQPNNVHKAIIRHAYLALRQLDINVHIVQMNTQNYFSYLAAKGLKNSESSRAAWAADYYLRIISNN